MAEISREKPTESDLELLNGKTSKSGKRGKNAQIILDFLAGGEPAEVVYRNGDVYQARSINQSLIHSIGRLDLKAQVGTKLRGGVIFLAHKDTPPSTARTDTPAAAQANRGEPIAA